MRVGGGWVGDGGGRSKLGIMVYAAVHMMQHFLARHKFKGVADQISFLCNLPHPVYSRFGDTFVYIHQGSSKLVLRRAAFLSRDVSRYSTDVPFW